jgi:cytochrome c oxidase subunit 1
MSPSVTPAPNGDAAAVLERTWADPPGLGGWFSHVDHKSIGRRYLVTAFLFFGLGGALAAAMRLQLSRSDNASSVRISTTRSFRPTAPR